jgi:hypothetical protein
MLHRGSSIDSYHDGDITTAYAECQGRLRGGEEAKLFGAARRLCTAAYIELLANIGGVVLDRLDGILVEEPPNRCARSVAPPSPYNAT